MLRHRPRWRRWLRGTGRVALGCLGFIVVYAVVFLTTGAITVNHQQVQPTDGVEIWVCASPTHSDLILPVQNDVHDWRQEFPVQDFTSLGCYTTHVVFGWGDRGFYIDVGDWENLTVMVTLRALFYVGRSVMHVDYMTLPATNDHQRRIVLGDDQYRALVDYIRTSFARDAQGHTKLIPGFSYWGTDAFYEGVGRYGLFYTCNTWTNVTLRRAGVRTSLWAVFAQNLLPHLPAPPP